MTDLGKSVVRDAATVVLLRPPQAPGSGPQVLLLGRPASAKFAPGTQVFPGGSVDYADSDQAWAHLLDPNAANSKSQITEPRLKLAAIRETFEECQILLARGPDGAPCTAAQLAAVEAVRPRLRSGDPSALRTAFESVGLRPDLDGLVFCAHWITPEGLPRRFDTRFFLAPLPPGQNPQPDPLGEHSSLRWVDPGIALEEARQGICQMLPPTRAVLAQVASAHSLEEALAIARETPVITIQPRLEEVNPERYPGLDLATLRGH